ncbi:unnamed protein product [Tenebrio molitor]|nr:unnamed protein product [Tenebrio molitor]
MLFVGNIFLYIINIQEDRPLSNREIVSVIFCALGSLACIFAIYKYQQLHDLSQDILSFLFRCPISKLSPLESAQIEMLITTLTLQKPQLKASDIFTIGTRLLPSVSGTVLTYVLVALQFHALWSK